METNKNNKKMKALKIFGLFMLVLIIMNVLMTYMVAKHSSGKELDILKKEIEGLKYELNLAKEENNKLLERLDSIEIAKANEENAIKNATAKGWDNKKIKGLPKRKVSKTTKIQKGNTSKVPVKEFNLAPLSNVYHVDFEPMYYKDVEYDIIRGKLKIPEEKSEYKMEIEKKVEEAKLEENKYTKYDIIIKRAKSYGQDVSYLDYEFLDYVFEEADKFNVNPYVILGIVSGESNFYAGAKNKKSSATGLGQIVHGTGKYIHTNVLGYKTEYNHNIQKDPKTNIKYMLGYFKYLKKYNSYDKAMGEYCGSKTYYANTYRNKLMKNMVALGLSQKEADKILRGQIV